ncbi:MAG: DHH family phosphoesterase [Paludibacteraceae bacterium]
MLSKIIAESLIHKAKVEIEEAENIVIVTHVGPDGDAMGSALGLWHFLMSENKPSKVIVPSPPPNFLMWMPGAEHINIYMFSQEESDEIISKADLIFVLDLNASSRLNGMSQVVLNSKARKVMVDHHPNPEDFANVIISYPEVSSTSELVFRLICRMGYFGKINLPCAECIYVGMMTDTGGFTYNSNHEEIYTIIYELLRIGIDKDEIYRKIFNTYSEDRMRLMGYCLHEKMKIYPQYNTALITLSKDELVHFNYNNGDAEGFVNIPLSIKGIIFSVFMREDPCKIKVSLRSEGTFPVNKFAADFFNGGGHLNASGGESYTSLEEAIEIFEKGLEQYKEFLQRTK